MLEKGSIVLIMSGQFKGQEGLIRGCEKKQDTEVYEVNVIKTDIEGDIINYGNTIELLEHQFVGLRKPGEKPKPQEKQVTTTVVNVTNAVDVEKRKPGRPKKSEAKQELAEKKTTLKTAKKSDEAKEEKKEIMENKQDLSISKTEIELIEKNEQLEFDELYNFIKTLFTFDELKEVARRITIDVDGYLNDLEILKAKYGFKI